MKLQAAANAPSIQPTTGASPRAAAFNTRTDSMRSLIAGPSHGSTSRSFFRSSTSWIKGTGQYGTPSSGTSTFAPTSPGSRTESEIVHRQSMPYFS